MKTRLNVSLSATSSDDTTAFISSMLVMMLCLYKRDTNGFKNDFKDWSAAASRFVKAFGFAKTYTQFSNIYSMKQEIDEDLAQDIGRILKSKKDDFERDTSISHEQLALLKDIGSNLRFSSEKSVVSSWNRIRKNVRNLKNPKLSGSFLAKKGAEDDVNMKDIKAAAPKLAALVTKVGGEGYFLNITQMSELRKANPTSFSAYAKLVKVLNQAVKAETLNYVRSSGKTLVTIDELQKYLAKKGIPNNLPIGFIGGQIDEEGKCYTAEGRQLDKIPTGRVRMNPDYNPESDDTYVIKSIENISGRKPEYRTNTMVKEKAKQRFSKVGEFIAQEKEHRAAWTKDILATPKDKRGKRKQVTAAIVELIYATSARIGGVGNATAGEPTYGMSTLQVRHLAIKKNQIAFDYTGKKGAQQGAHYKVKDAVSKKIYEILTELVHDKKPEDRVFVVEGKPLNRAAVNEYLKSKGITLSIHKFRNVAGTKAAQSIIAKSPFKKSDKPKQAAVEKWFKEAAIEIGEMLHHRNGEKITSSTSIASYIDQQVIADYFESLGLRKPKWLKKLKD